MKKSTGAKTNQEAINSVESKVLSRLKQELSFISSYKNLDTQVNQVEKEIESYFILISDRVFLVGGDKRDGNIPQDNTNPQMSYLCEVQ